MSKRRTQSDQAGFLRKQCNVKILEQPEVNLAFSHRTSVPIVGVSSKQQKKTFPTIRVDGYIGTTMVVVSCVTKDEPYRPHPFNLVGGKSCHDGVCTLMIPADTMRVEFPNIRIQSVKKEDVRTSLSVREAIKVDPFSTGFNHKNDPNSINLNAVRLCFQVYLEGSISGDYCIPLQPKVSQPIYNKISDLFIVKLSECSYPVDADKELILLCKRVDKNDIKIRFFEEKRGKILWEAYANFCPSQVHYSTAISFKPPRYHNLAIEQSAKVFVQLVRPSNRDKSERLPFEFLPAITLRRQLKQNENSKISLLKSKMNMWFQDFAHDLLKTPSTNDESFIKRSEETVGFASMPSTSSELSLSPSTGSTFSDENSTSTRPVPMLTPACSLPLNYYYDIYGVSACFDLPIKPNVTSDLDDMTSDSPDEHHNAYDSHRSTESVNLTTDVLEMQDLHKQHIRIINLHTSRFNDYEEVDHLPS
ncbi:hypothetical protein WA026_002027 [Henosepilachna vigintioctopunctata]|uniref:RHD domain-containing protein n=1 Tax=Henosepilachna vigintioctopunctata TaxID=420089 RepID=A0AAW1URY4_9CUCU